MLSKIIRLGAAVSGAVILASCGGGSGQTLTQQSTPEGLFTGANKVFINNTGVFPADPGNAPATCPQNMLVFVEYSGAFFAFYPSANNPASMMSASSGTLSFSGGTMSAGGILEVAPPVASSCGTYPNPTGTNTATLTGGYNTGSNIAAWMNYPSAIDSATPPDFKATYFNLSYNFGYQGIQSLATLAGTYVGTVGTSQFSEAATFTFSPASVAANSANQFGVATVTGTSASGCAYTGTVSPLFKGNGYSVLISSGASPCRLTNANFSGLVYLDTASNILYSFSPNQARNDGLIFSGIRK